MFTNQQLKASLVSFQGIRYLRAANFAKRRALEMEEDALQQIEAAVACTPSEGMVPLLRNFLGKGATGLQATADVGVAFASAMGGAMAPPPLAMPPASTPGDYTRDTTSPLSTSTPSSTPPTTPTATTPKKWLQSNIAKPELDAVYRAPSKGEKRQYTCPHKGCLGEGTSGSNQEHIRAHIRAVHDKVILCCDRGAACVRYNALKQQSYQTYNAELFARHANKCGSNDCFYVKMVPVPGVTAAEVATADLSKK